MGSSRRPPPVAESVGERKKGIDDLEGTNHCSYLNSMFVPSGNRNISIQWRLIPHPPVTATVPSNSLSQRRAAWLAAEAATLAHCLRRVLLPLQRWQLLQQYTGNFFSGVLPQPGYQGCGREFRLCGRDPALATRRRGHGIDVHDVLLVEVQQAEGAPGSGARPAGGSGRGGAGLRGSLASATTTATPPSTHARNAARASGRSEQNALVA